MITEDRKTLEEIKRRRGEYESGYIGYEWLLLSVLEAAEAERDKLLDLLREARDVLQQVPKLARGPSRELWDGIMVDVLAAKRRIDAALEEKL